MIGIYVRKTPIPRKIEILSSTVVWFCYPFFFFFFFFYIFISFSTFNVCLHSLYKSSVYNKQITYITYIMFCLYIIKIHAIPGFYYERPIWINIQVIKEQLTSNHEASVSLIDTYLPLTWNRSPLGVSAK